MSGTRNLKAGIIIALSGVSIIAAIGSLQLVGLAAFYCLFGWVGIKLYEIRVNTWLGLLLFKVPLNVAFNPFFLILLLKSWTLLKYREQFQELERNLHTIE